MKRKINFLISSFLLMGVFFIFVSSCDKDGDNTNTIPIVNTTEVTDITTTTFISGGNITDDGGAIITARGVCWSKIQNPTISGSKTEDGTGTGRFTSSISGLEPNTTYYLRAYATNKAGTGYGSERTFTTRDEIPNLTTADVTDITTKSATSGGVISDDGGLPITARGVCWNNSGSPTLDDSKTIDDLGALSFTSSISGLEPNTTYYVRAYATNEAGTGHGPEKTFTTKDGIPDLTTAEVTDITANSATSGGVISDDGGLPITACGVCWNNSGSPTLNDNITSDILGTASFTSQLTGLNAETDYYIRAYATNEQGTSYGNEVFFSNKTSGTFIDPRDGEVYKWVKIGNQIWMAENLKYLPNVVGPATGSATIPYYYVYGYDGTVVDDAKATANYTTYGVLYNWPAFIDGAANSTQGICPTGWHLPSVSEMSELEDYLGGQSVGAGKLKETGTTHWTSPNTGATNETGFTALPGGSRSNDGLFWDIGDYGYWWLANSATSRDLIRMSSNDSSLAWFFSFSEIGFSVRCVRD